MIWRKWLLLLAVLGCVVATAQQIPNPFSPDNIIHTNLPNGLRVILREDHAQPFVAMEVVIRNGSAAEVDAVGVAHYLEHLCFRRTDSYPKTLAPQFALETAGAVSNAVTNRDVTRFQATVPSDNLPLLMRVVAGIVFRPTFTDDDVRDEQATLAAEMAHEDDNPIALLANTAYAATYHLYPYRHSPLGTIADIKLITPAALRAYHRRWYVPGNISIVLVGDIVPRQAIELLTASFGQNRLITPPAMPLYTEAQSTGKPAVVHLPSMQSDTYQMMAFPAPAGSDLSTRIALEVLKNVLIGGPDPLLPTCWAKEGLRVNRFGIEYTGLRYPGRFLIWAQTPPEMAARLRRATQELLHQLANNFITNDRLNTAKLSIATQFLLSNETYSQQAATLAYYEGIGEAAMASRVIPTLNSITAEHVRKTVPVHCLAWVTYGQPPKGQ